MVDYLVVGTSTVIGIIVIGLVQWCIGASQVKNISEFIGKLAEPDRVTHDVIVQVSYRQFYVYHPSVIEVRGTADIRHMVKVDHWTPETYDQIYKDTRNVLERNGASNPVIWIKSITKL